MYKYVKWVMGLPDLTGECKFLLLFLACECDDDGMVPRDVLQEYANLSSVGWRHVVRRLEKLQLLGYIKIIKKAVVAEVLKKGTYKVKCPFKNYITSVQLIKRPEETC